MWMSCLTKTSCHLATGGWIIIWFMFCHRTFTGQQARLWSHLIILQPMVSTLIFSDLSLLDVIFKNYFPCFLDIKKQFVRFSRVHAFKLFRTTNTHSSCGEITNLGDKDSTLLNLCLQWHKYQGNVISFILSELFGENEGE